MPAMTSGASASTRNCSSISNSMRSTGSSGRRLSCSAASDAVSRSASPSATPRNEAKSSVSGEGCRCGANHGSATRPRCRRLPRKCRSRSPLKARTTPAHSSATLLFLPHACAASRWRCERRRSFAEPDDSWCDSFSSRSKQRWKYSATSGRSASSHLLTNESRNASAGSLKISTFSAQVMTVRGDISVDRSPAAKPLRVSSATATIAATSLRPASSASEGTRACTIAISSSPPAGS
jgi:hypothetical protein